MLYLTICDTDNMAGDDTESWDTSVKNPSVYIKFREIAYNYLTKECTNQALQPSELVYEIYLRMTEQGYASCETERDFLIIAARIVREVLVDHTRTCQRAKQEACWLPTALAVDKTLEWVETKNYDLLALDTALGKLSQINKLHGQIIELIFFGGLSFQEVADFLSIPERDVQRYWKLARAWLYSELACL